MIAVASTESAEIVPVAEPVAARPKVCQLLHSLNVGGAEILATRIARQLDASYRMLFVCLDELGAMGERLQSEGFDVHLLRRGSGLDSGCARRLAHLIQAEQVDLIHAHQYTPFFYALLSGWFRHRPGVLFTEHGRWYPDYPRRKRILFNRLMLRSRDRVVGVGEAVRRALIDNEGLSPKRVSVVYNGINLEPYAGSSENRAEVLRDIDCAEGDLVVMQIARLDHLKDHLTALRTIDRVRKVLPSAKLVLVGEGPERPKIEAEIAQRQLQSHVRLLGLRSDVARLLSVANLFLLTSISEGIPLTLIESMAAGVPIVSTDVGGVREVVDDGRTGILAPSGNDQSLADALLYLADNESLRLIMAERGRQRASQQFSERTMLESYRQLYEEMLHVRR